MELQLATLQTKANPPVPGLCDFFDFPEKAWCFQLEEDIKIQALGIAAC
jgi:hypothetical protein